MSDDLARFPTPKEVFKQPRKPVHMSPAYNNVGNVPIPPLQERHRQASNPRNVDQQRQFSDSASRQFSDSARQGPNSSARNFSDSSRKVSGPATAHPNSSSRSFSPHSSTTTSAGYPPTASRSQTPPVGPNNMRSGSGKTPQPKPQQYLNQRPAAAAAAAAAPQYQPQHQPQPQQQYHHQQHQQHQYAQQQQHSQQISSYPGSAPPQAPHHYGPPVETYASAAPSSAQTQANYAPVSSNYVPANVPPANAPPANVVNQRTVGGPVLNPASQAALSSSQSLPLAPKEPQVDPPQAQASADLRSLFDDVDRHKRGYLTERELSKALVNADYTLFDTHTVRLLMKIFDRDGDGAIYFAEFGQMWKYLYDWRQVFDRFDVNRNDNISLEEFSKALAAFGYTLSTPCVRFMFNAGSKLNRQGQRAMSFDMFVQSCMSIKSITDTFKRYDTDRDGYVTVAFEDFLMETTKLH